MPLSYDDIPGSWGTYSRDWPSINFSNEKDATRGYVACTKENLVPYGSYVLVKNSLRVETQEYKTKLIKHLNETTKTTEEVLKEYESKSRNSAV